MEALSDVFTGGVALDEFAPNRHKAYCDTLEMLAGIEGLNATLLHESAVVQTLC